MIFSPLEEKRLLLSISKVHVFFKRFDEKVLVFLQTQFQDYTYSIELVTYVFR